MKRLLLFSQLVLIISFGCNNKAKKETKTITISNTSQNMYCYPIESPLLGQNYLSESFLNSVAEIKKGNKKLDIPSFAYYDGEGSTSRSYKPSTVSKINKNFVLNHR